MKGFYIIGAVSVGLAWLVFTFGDSAGATQAGRVAYCISFVASPALIGLAIAVTKAVAERRQGKPSTFATDLQWIWGGYLAVIGVMELTTLAARAAG